MLHLASGLNTEGVKYFIVVLLTPLWLPFVKALWKTLNDALREEGGLLGAPPTEEQLRELQRDDPLSEAMISEEKFSPFSADRLDGRKGGSRSPVAGSRHGASTGGAQSGSSLRRPRGFG